MRIRLEAMDAGLTTPSATSSSACLTIRVGNFQCPKNELQRSSAPLVSHFGSLEPPFVDSFVVSVAISPAHPTRC
jgi:hypothetical protein